MWDNIVEVQGLGPKMFQLDLFKSFKFGWTDGDCVTQQKYGSLLNQQGLISEDH